MTRPLNNHQSIEIPVGMPMSCKSSQVTSGGSGGVSTTSREVEEREKRGG